MHARLLWVVILLISLVHFGNAWRRRRRRPSPVNCAVSSWKEWGDCSKTCEGGTQKRIRTITRHAAHGGSGCPTRTQTRGCNPQHCPIDCQWGEWGEWSQCSPCWPNSRGRTRNVVRAAQFGGNPCLGVNTLYDGECTPEGNCTESSCKAREFSCADQLTCIRSRLQCNGDDDCTDYSDEDDCGTTIRNPCRKPHGGIPNVDIAGAGFDIIQNEESGHILNNEQYNGRCTLVRSGDHGKRFRKPHNIQYYRFQVSVDTSLVTKSYKSAKQFVQEEKGDFQRKIKSDSSFSFGDVFSISGGVATNTNRNTKRIIARGSKTDSKYFKITSELRVAQFRTLRRNFILSVPLRERLSGLPDHYDYGKYAEVIHDFGTHFYSSGKLGGKYEFIYRYSRKDLKTSGLSDSEQKDCLQLEASFSLFKFKLGGSKNKCTTNLLSKKNNGSFTRSAREVISNVRGGLSNAAASLSFFTQNAANNADYDRWVEDVKTNPAIIDFTLRPMSSALPQGPRRTNMERALVDYLQRFNPTHCTVPCANNGTHVVVNAGKECKCLCDAGFIGTSCAQVVP